jgi:putative ABC transport system permease protein
MAIGVDPAKVENLGAVGLLNIEEGRNINKSDYLGIIIGNKISTDTFKRPVRLGQKIVMGDKTLRVVGINGKAMHSFGAIFNNAIIMNSRALKDIDQNLSPARIIVTAVEGADLEKLKSDIKAKLKKDHGSEDFQVLTMSQIGETATSVIGIITLVIMGIAAISLVVGGIGIMNTMLMAVMERTREIGVMKAIGATNNRILSIFLAESAIIGIIGGVIGVAVGAAIGFAVFAVSEAIGMPIYTMTSLPVALGAIAFAMAVGIIAGIVPARRAARLDAVEALRYE